MEGKILENAVAAWNEYNSKGKGTIQEYEAFKAGFEYGKQLAEQILNSKGLIHKTKEGQYK